MPVPSGRSNKPLATFGLDAEVRRFLSEVRAMVPAPFVIIDTPAASAVPEPQILARLSDALVIVVAANGTPREIVEQARPWLEEFGHRNLAVLFRLHYPGLRVERTGRMLKLFAVEVMPAKASGARSDPPARSCWRARSCATFILARARGANCR